MRKAIMYVLSVSALVVGSCSKDDPAPAPLFPNVAEAKAEHDNKSGGIYKGTFANPTGSGTIKVVLQEGVTQIIIVFNGVSRTLTTTDLAGWTSGDAISGASFTSSDWTVVFTVAADGSTFDIGLDLGGVTSFDGALVKETSTALVRVYEGTFAGDATGKWNFCTQNNLIAGVYSGSSGGSLDGAVTGTSITMSDGSDVTAIGTFTNELKDCSGTWSSTSGDSGTWTGTRKL